jgi:hypothetical protein
MRPRVIPVRLVGGLYWEYILPAEDNPGGGFGTDQGSTRCYYLSSWSDGPSFDSRKFIRTVARR